MVFSSLSGYLINLGAHLMVNYSQGSAKTPAEDSPHDSQCLVGQ